MYYQNYEDYMRSVLGYSIEPDNTYAAYSRPYENPQMYQAPTRYNNELLELYPDIYRIINPMVCKICEENTKPITRELVEEMTDEIYMNLEVQPEIDTVVNVRANTCTSKTELESNRSSLNSSSKNSNSLDSKMKNTSSRSSSSPNLSSTNYSEKEKQNREKKEIEETRQIQAEHRQRRPDDRFLRDLIRVLILNQLLGGNFSNIPPRPPRPPMPPRPPVRPPFPREDRFYKNYLRY